MDPDALYDVIRILAVAVSPDGDRVAYLASEADPDEDEMRTSLFVVPTDGSQAPHRLTHVADASSPTWSPEGRFLGFVATHEEDTERAVSEDDDEFLTEDAEESEDDPRSQVWVFDMELGGDARQITTFERGVKAFD